MPIEWAALKQLSVRVRPVESWAHVWNSDYSGARKEASVGPPAPSPPPESGESAPELRAANSPPAPTPHKSGGSAPRLRAAHNPRSALGRCGARGARTRSCGATRARCCSGTPLPLPSRTKWTRLVHPSVLTGRATRARWCSGTTRPQGSVAPGTTRRRPTSAGFRSRSGAPVDPSMPVLCFRRCAMKVFYFQKRHHR